ncbi:hypothetical protein ACLOJK_028384 [Asimina triloba]
MSEFFNFNIIKLISPSIFPKPSAFVVVTGRCLDRMIQATHLTGDACPSPATTTTCLHRMLAPLTICPMPASDACTARRDACFILLLAPPAAAASTARLSCPFKSAVTLARRRGSGTITAAHADDRPRQH